MKRLNNNCNIACLPLISHQPWDKYQNIVRFKPATDISMDVLPGKHFTSELLEILWDACSLQIVVSEWIMNMWQYGFCYNSYLYAKY